MKYYEKRRHLITKLVLGLLVAIAIFFALCDCAPKSQPNEVTITFERE
ncbi:MAG: hypothetical protein II938_01020 [Alphaproteobacteria bacterium]|nr:hypothetical protein [Alphaproteobacteria bacterium]